MILTIGWPWVLLALALLLATGVAGSVVFVGWLLSVYLGGSDRPWAGLFVAVLEILALALLAVAVFVVAWLLFGVPPTGRPLHF